jgi:hypothetical protein
MDLTLKQIKTLLHALEISAQQYEEHSRRAALAASVVRGYSCPPDGVAESYEQMAARCGEQATELRNLAANLKIKYRREAEKEEE